MRSLWRLSLTIVVVIGFAIPLAPPAVVAAGVGDDCSAVAKRLDRKPYEGSGKSLEQADLDAISKCAAGAPNPDNCTIETHHCNATSTAGATSNQRWIDGLRQKKIPVNWESVLVAATVHLLWIWHIVSQNTLAVSAKAGLGFGVPLIQDVLAYVLGSDGEIGLLELPIFALPLGLGELVASFSFKRRSE